MTLQPYFCKERALASRTVRIEAFLNQWLLHRSEPSDY